MSGSMWQRTLIYLGLREEPEEEYDELPERVVQEYDSGDNGYHAADAGSGNQLDAIQITTGTQRRRWIARPLSGRALSFTDPREDREDR